MAIRVTQNTMYNSMVSGMQQNLGAYMESVQQGSTQKKINRPSDDPAGTYRVLTTRQAMVDTAQYQENVDTAKGWLNLADSILSSNVTTAITGLKTLAEQASTGTYTAEQRMIMADQARQYFGQLLNLSNTKFEDMHIFGGHKYDQSAFELGLGVTSWDENWDSAVSDGLLQVQGSTDRTVLVQFTDNGPLKQGTQYQWSNDGGNTWHEGTVEFGKDDKGVWGYQLKPAGSGVTMTIPVNQLDGKEFDHKNFNLQGPLDFTNPDTWNDPDVAIPQVMVPNPKYDPKKPYELNEDGSLKTDDDGNKIEVPKVIPLDVTTGFAEQKDYGPKNGTFLYIRPTAIYMGDDKDPPVDVTLMGAGDLTNKRSPDVEGNPIQATGSFPGNVLVRVDGSENRQTGQMEDVDLWNPGQEFTWSYSTDGGSTWITARGKVPGDGKLRLPLPNGYIDYDLNNYDEKTGKPDGKLNDGELRAGMMANVHPSRADLNYEIMEDTYLAVNSVGKDVFGGYYNGKPAMGDSDYNLFEVVGSFIGYLEGNNQEGCQRTLAALTKAETKVLAEATRIGGMENRVEMAADVLSFQKIDQQERLSYTEDIDLTELLTKLTRQQLAYQTVLQSSSMIMQMSLLNYV